MFEGLLAIAATLVGVIIGNRLSESSKERTHIRQWWEQRDVLVTSMYTECLHHCTAIEHGEYKVHNVWMTFEPVITDIVRPYLFSLSNDVRVAMAAAHRELSKYNTMVELHRAGLLDGQTADAQLQGLIISAQNAMLRAGKLMQVRHLEEVSNRYDDQGRLIYADLPDRNPMYTLIVVIIAALLLGITGLASAGVLNLHEYIWRALMFFLGVQTVLFAMAIWRWS